VKRHLPGYEEVEETVKNLSLMLNCGLWMKKSNGGNFIMSPFRGADNFRLLVAASSTDISVS
jgi:hypothetical protein